MFFLKARHLSRWKPWAMTHVLMPLMPMAHRSLAGQRSIHPNGAMDGEKVSGCAVGGSLAGSLQHLLCHRPLARLWPHHHCSLSTWKAFQVIWMVPVDSLMIQWHYMQETTVESCYIWIFLRIAMIFSMSTVSPKCLTNCLQLHDYFRTRTQSSLSFNDTWCIELVNGKVAERPLTIGFLGRWSELRRQCGWLLVWTSNIAYIVAQMGASIKTKASPHWIYILLDEHCISSLLFLKNGRAGYIRDETRHAKVSQIVPHKIDTVCFMDDRKM